MSGLVIGALVALVAVIGMFVVPLLLNVALVVALRAGIPQQKDERHGEF